MSYTAIADKLDHEIGVLWQMMEREDESSHHYMLLTQQAKRVKSQSTLLIREFASRRDHLQRSAHKEN